MEFYSVTEFAKKINKSISTIRLWDKNHTLKPQSLTPGGQRMYSQAQVDEFLGIKPIEEISTQVEVKKVMIGYCRVSTRQQKDDLERQVELVRTYMTVRGYQFEVIVDIGSGINYQKKGLTE